MIRSDKEDPVANEEAHAALRLTVTSNDSRKLGRLFQAKITELGLANIPGNTSRGATGNDGSPVVVYWPALIDSKHVSELVHLGADLIEVLPTQRLDFNHVHYENAPVEIDKIPIAEVATIAFGRLFGTRSGDKGGCANCGVWARTDAAYSFLYYFLTVDQLKKLLPDMRKFDIERYELPNIRALNFYIHDVLGDGASSSHRIDKQAKSLGEYLRAKIIEVPQALIEELGVEV